jgi:DNA-binding HxlR family transcriptional regulator
MKWDDLAAEPCSAARALAVIGDRWTLLVLRDCFLGISRTLVAARLKLLTDEGVLARTPYQDKPLRHEYRLTEKGLALHPVIMAIVHWGDRFYAGEAGPPLIHRHRVCGHDFHPVMTCSECGEPVTAREVETRPGPGARA